MLQGVRFSYYISFSSFTFPGAPYWISLLYRPKFPCHFYLSSNNKFFFSSFSDENCYVGVLNEDTAFQHLVLKKSSVLVFFRTKMFFLMLRFWCRVFFSTVVIVGSTFDPLWSNGFRLSTMRFWVQFWLQKNVFHNKCLCNYNIWIVTITI